MSEGEDNEADAQPCSCCASCGIVEVDDIKLVPCDDCDLVEYCGDECRENHKSVHEEDCKKRATELREEILFKQPESSHLGDCPICSLPMPIEMAKSMMFGCCSKTICSGCAYAYQMRQREGRLANTCPFCREPLPRTEEENDKRSMKRVAANDPFAIYQEGGKQYEKGDYRSAFEYYSKAAELGYASAHHTLAWLYQNGEGVEKDGEKFIHHLEEAAIGGNPLARHDLGCHENKNGNFERAVKYWIISATQGLDGSLKTLMEAFKQGHVSKEVLAAALRAHKAAVDATKSPQRVAAEGVFHMLISPPQH